ncbi:MAG: hypothetical protein FWE90_12180 [Defluviitaleaceae bacterium]|nr:hypothetical protein [Defluviitaleaceae bacterium]
MKILPKVNEAVIPIEKFTKYALDPINGKGKHSAFEMALGYNLGNVALLIENIRNNLYHYPALYKGDNEFGTTYSVLMCLVGVNGKTANVLTSWIDDKQTGQMRLTSAYIKKRKGADHD